MRYIVIGGNGFVGRYLVKELSKLNKTVIWDIEQDKKLDIYNDSNVEYKNIDIRDIDTIRKEGFQEDDVVIHLAANQYHKSVPISDSKKKEYFFLTNVDGTKNILKVMEECKCSKMVFYSTYMVYGVPCSLPVKINHRLNPIGYYGQSKKEAEDVINEYRSKGMKITVFRPRMIMGPGRLGVLEKLFKLFDNNWIVPLIGDGSNCYQMISVFDCVSVTLKTIECDFPNKNYNLGSINPPTVYELLSNVIQNNKSASKLVRTNGKLVKFVLRTLESLHIPIMQNEQYEIADFNYILDISETIIDLNWEPKYNDADMLSQAYEYYKGKK